MGGRECDGWASEHQPGTEGEEEKRISQRATTETRMFRNSPTKVLRHNKLLGFKLNLRLRFPGFSRLDEHGDMGDPYVNRTAARDYRGARQNTARAGEGGGA